MIHTSKCKGSLVAWVAVVLIGITLPNHTFSAEYTDVLDAADDLSDGDESTYDPFDFEIKPAFSYSASTSSISREAPCVPSLDSYGPENDPARPAVYNNERLIADPSRCSEPRVVYKNEMRYRHTRSQVDLNLTAGLYKDLEFHLSIPYVFSSNHALKYDNESSEMTIDSSNSHVNPAQNIIRGQAAQNFSENDSYEAKLRKLDTFGTYSFFSLSNQYSGYSRSGLANPTIGLDWAPYNDDRDPTKATLMLGADYTMPIAPTKKAQNTAVARGLHRFDFQLRASKRFDWIDPYFGLEYSLPKASSGSPIAQKPDADNIGQVFDSPPQKGEMTVGSEFIIDQDKDEKTKYAIDFRLFFGYSSAGRTYTPLFDHMARSQCNGKTVNQILPRFNQQGQLENPSAVGCAWLLQQPSNFQGSEYAYDLGSLSNQERQNTTFRTNGIMNQDSFGEFGGQLGLFVQPSEMFRIEALGRFTHRQGHLISNARLGRDLPDSKENNADNAVDLQVSEEERDNNLSPTDVERERNPFHNETYDSPGKRFRLDGLNTWKFTLNASVLF